MSSSKRPGSNSKKRRRWPASSPAPTSSSSTSPATSAKRSRLAATRRSCSASMPAGSLAAFGAADFGKTARRRRSTRSTTRGSPDRSRRTAEERPEAGRDRPRQDRRLARRRRRLRRRQQPEQPRRRARADHQRRRPKRRTRSPTSACCCAPATRPGVTAISGKASRLLDPQRRTRPASRWSSPPRASGSRSATACRRRSKASSPVGRDRSRQRRLQGSAEGARRARRSAASPTAPRRCAWSKAWCSPGEQRLRTKRGPTSPRSATSRSAPDEGDLGDGEADRRPGEVAAGRDAPPPGSASTCWRSSGSSGRWSGTRASPSGSSPRPSATTRPAGPGPGRHLAARFAAKEAVVKALGLTGGFGLRRDRGARRRAADGAASAARAAEAARARPDRDLADPLARVRRGAVAIGRRSTWSPGWSPLFDAEGMRAVDRWAIEEQGVPEAELMEAAGTALADAVAGLAPQRPGAGPLRQGQQRRRRPGRRAPPARERLRGRGARALRRRAARPTSTPGSRAAARSSTRSSAPASRARRASRRRRRSRRRTAAARRSSPATSPPASTPRAARSTAPRSRRRSRSASTPPSSATGSRPGSGTPASCGSRRSASPTAPRSTPAGGDDRRRRPRPAPRARRRARPSSAPARSTIAGGSRGLTGAVRMSSLAAIRAGAGYATVAVPADLEAIFEAGPARGDVGRLPGRRRLSGAGLGEGGPAAPSRAPPPACSGPGSAATRARSSWSREVLGAIEAPLVLDADGLNAFAGRPRGDRRARSADGPHPARRGARPPARARLRGGRAPTASPAPARRPRRRRRRRAQGRRHDRHRRRAASAGSTPLRQRARAWRTAGHRRRALRDRRGAARPRPRALRGGLRGGPRPCPRRARGGPRGSAPPSR